MGTSPVILMEVGGERESWSWGAGALTADGKHERMALEEAMTMRELEAWEEGKSEEKAESLRRQACGTNKNPQNFAPGSSAAWPTR